MSLIFGKFSPSSGYDNEKHIYMSPEWLVIYYFFNQNGHYEAIVVKQRGDSYIMDSNINGTVKRAVFSWNDLYLYLKSDFRLQFAVEYIDSEYYTHGTKRVLSRAKKSSRRKSRKASKKTRSRKSSKTKKR